ncbi:unnamed protein product [Gadus morhua 'NCC']
MDVPPSCQPATDFRTEGGTSLSHSEDSFELHGDDQTVGRASGESVVGSPGLQNPLGSSSLRTTSPQQGPPPCPT